MRKPMIAGNWKMFGSRREVEGLVSGIKMGVKECSDVDVVIFPSFVHLQQVADLVEGSPIGWGAQNLYLGTTGAFTGEISGAMLSDMGCQYVLIGHSERRLVFHEDLDLVAAKYQAALKANLKPILCVGETLVQREKGETTRVIQTQLESVIDLVGIEVLRQSIIAYEPVWAIGTGLTAMPEQAQEVHEFIRQIVAKTARILYGGSVKPDNAAGLFSMPDIDGGLVGGASLEPQGFLKICQAGKCTSLS